MAKKGSVTVGIEYTGNALRAAKSTYRGVGKDAAFFLEQLEEINDDFSNENKLAESLKEIKSKICKDKNTRIVTCVSGKQVYVSLIPFKPLPEEEMVEALRFEVRKNISFDVSTATIAYQLEDEADGKTAVPVLVTVAANQILNKHLQIFSRVHIKPDIVDVLPLALANAFWVGREELDPGIAAAIVHIAPGVCTLIVDGGDCQFFNRNIYFQSDGIFGSKEEEVVDSAERLRRLDTLAEEILRSLSFYKQTYQVAGFSGTFLLGEHAAIPELKGLIEQKIRIPVAPLDLAKRCGSSEKGDESGKFDLAIALSLRRDFV
jgi:Tfp pilus assembly PilM family ATPase